MESEPVNRGPQNKKGKRRIGAKENVKSSAGKNQEPSRREHREGESELRRDSRGRRGSKEKLQGEKDRAWSEVCQEQRRYRERRAGGHSIHIVTEEGLTTH